MNNLLDHLQAETLPKPVVEAFVEWCVWEQARAALMVVLKKTGLAQIADEFDHARDLPALQALIGEAINAINQARRRTGPLGISAAEAAAFEFTNLMKAASEQAWDPEEVAFFASRVCGWAGWAASDFSQPVQKGEAEQDARRAQENRLQELLGRFTTNS